MNSVLNITDLISLILYILLLAALLVCFFVLVCLNRLKYILIKRNKKKGMLKRKRICDKKHKSETQTYQHAKRPKFKETVDVTERPKLKETDDVTERPKLKETVDVTDEHKPEAADNQLQQDQILLLHQRNLEASRQMLYGVFGNLIAILEEYESRTYEGTPALPRSNITSPDQSRKTLEDVKGIVEGQLLAFQLQSKACPSSVRKAVNKELRKKTLIWEAVREERKLEMQDTDTFICQLYEILAKGKTCHGNLYNTSRESASSETIRDTIPHIMQGTHDAASLDESFKKDPTKKASGPKTRIADADYSFKLGASRLKREMPDLSDDLDEDVDYFLLDGPDDIK